MGLVDVWMIENHIQQKRKQQFTNLRAINNTGKPIHLRQLRDKGLQLVSGKQIPAEMRSEEYKVKGLDENESTLSGNS